MIYYEDIEKKIKKIFEEEKKWSDSSGVCKFDEKYKIMDNKYLTAICYCIRL